MREINWLWPNRIALGKLTLIAGHPDLGKSTVALSLAAIASTGGFWPASRQTSIQGAVVILTSEDDIEDTVRPRFVAAGGDDDMVEIVEMVRVESEEEDETVRGFSLRLDIEKLGRLIEKIGNVAAIVIDPITAYLGNPAEIDSHNMADVRAVLEPFVRMAAKYQVAIIAVTHLRKSMEGDKAMLLVAGSIALVASSRVTYFVMADLDDPDRRLFLTAKNNLGIDKTGFAYRIEPYTIPGTAIRVSRCVWEDQTVATTADAELNKLRKQQDPNRLRMEKEFLRRLLADGPVAKGILFADAKESGFSRPKIMEALNELGAFETVVERDHQGKPLVWGYMLG
jgi:hypothetical protein